jgi:GLPGLI family protein
MRNHMLKLIVIFSSILTIWSNIFAQDKAIYALYGKKPIAGLHDSMPPDMQNSPAGDWALLVEEKMKHIMPDLEYELIFTASESVFKPIERLVSDNQYYKLALLWADGDGIFYTNLTENQTLVQRNSFNNDFLVSQNAKQNDWVLLNEEKKIGPYTCYKTTRKIAKLNMEA